MTVSDSDKFAAATPAAAAATPVTVASPRASREALYFARRNRKLVGIGDAHAAPRIPTRVLGSTST